MDITKTEFQDLWKLNPSGDKIRTLESIEVILEKDFLDPDGLPLTIKSIHAAYEAYISYWYATYGLVEERYVAKENKLKDIRDWVSGLGFQKTWTIPDTNRSGYLFGGKSKKYLEERHKEFKRLIKRRK